MELVSLPAVTRYNSSKGILKAGGANLTLKDLKSTQLGISEEDKKAILKSDRTYIDGWMTDNAVFAYLFERASNTNTRVLSCPETQHLSADTKGDYNLIKNLREDGEPTWQDTDTILMPYNPGNHWVLMHASRSSQTVSCE